MDNPYSLAKGVRYSNGDVSLERNLVTVNKNVGDQVHVVLDGETLQSISYRYYGSSGFWHVISDANNIINPFEDFYAGLEILIPSL